MAEKEKEVGIRFLVYCTFGKERRGGERRRLLGGRGVWNAEEGRGRGIDLRRYLNKIEKKRRRGIVFMLLKRLCRKGGR